MVLGALWARVEHAATTVYKYDWKSVWEPRKERAEEFATDTTLHGIKNVARRNISLIQRHVHRVSTTKAYLTESSVRPS